MKGGPGSVRLRFLRRTVRTVPVFGSDGSFGGEAFSLFLHCLKEGQCTVLVSVPENGSDGSSFGSGRTYMFFLPS